MMGKKVNTTISVAIYEKLEDRTLSSKCNSKSISIVRDYIGNIGKYIGIDAFTTNLIFIV